MIHILISRYIVEYIVLPPSQIVSHSKNLGESKYFYV